ncbi:MAG: HAD-IIIA family hydrolase [candidate division KSB1 bacterium]|nr:HAD-IIIA family hydrolase [candidate division KSB1 bacterium]MDZ7319035.1 HAD-IIIA family hydrolase [candidate division KSB1 bacterium]MDZ7341452.1 HAD-IIIA family hydrolase [candidate division KSB1 bacterium]
MSLEEKISKIKLLLLDVDGVLTDGSIILVGANEEIKVFHIHDGLGIKLAQANGIEVGIITGRSSEAVKRRCAELAINLLYEGRQNKLEAYEQIKRQLQLHDEEIAYVGDDLPDLPILKKAGLSCAVNDAREEVKAVAAFVTHRPGGKGAVREVIELILKHQGKWDF